MIYLLIFVIYYFQTIISSPTFQPARYSNGGLNIGYMTHQVYKSNDCSGNPFYSFSIKADGKCVYSSQYASYIKLTIADMTDCNILFVNTFSNSDCSSRTNTYPLRANTDIFQYPYSQSGSGNCSNANGYGIPDFLKQIGYGTITCSTTELNNIPDTAISAKVYMSSTALPSQYQCDKSNYASSETVIEFGTIKALPGCTDTFDQNRNAVGFVPFVEYKSDNDWFIKLTYSYWTCSKLNALNIDEQSYILSQFGVIPFVLIGPTNVCIAYGFNYKRIPLYSSSNQNGFLVLMGTGTAITNRPSLSPSNNPSQALSLSPSAIKSPSFVSTVKPTSVKRIIVDLFVRMSLTGLTKENLGDESYRKGLLSAVAAVYSPIIFNFENRPIETTYTINGYDSLVSLLPTSLPVTLSNKPVYNPTNKPLSDSTIAPTVAKSSYAPTLSQVIGTQTPVASSSNTCLSPTSPTCSGSNNKATNCGYCCVGQTVGGSNLSPPFPSLSCDSSGKLVCTCESGLISVGSCLTCSKKTLRDIYNDKKVILENPALQLTVNVQSVYPPDYNIDAIKSSYNNFVSNSKGVSQSLQVEANKNLKGVTISSVDYPTVVNPAIVDPPSNSPSSAPNIGSNPSDSGGGSSSNGAIIGAAVGGAVGGLFLLICGFFAYFYYCKKEEYKATAKEDDPPKPKKSRSQKSHDNVNNNAESPEIELALSPEARDSIKRGSKGANTPPSNSARVDRSRKSNDGDNDNNQVAKKSEVRTVYL